MSGKYGNAWMSPTADAKASSPWSAFAFVHRCSTTKTPTGTTPDSECSLFNTKARLLARESGESCAAAGVIEALKPTGCVGEA
jgi:hypothetical protein